MIQMMMSLTICLINFSLFILPAALNFNIVPVEAQTGVAVEVGVVEEETPRAFALHPQLRLQLTTGAVEKVEHEDEDAHAHGGGRDEDPRSNANRMLIQSAPRRDRNSSEGPGSRLRLWQEQNQQANEQNLNTHQMQAEAGKLERMLIPRPRARGARPGAGTGYGHLIFTWDPQEFAEIPLADDGAAEKTTTASTTAQHASRPTKVEPKQFGGGQWDHYYYCGPGGRGNNCARLCRSLNYPRVSCGRNSCYCTW